MVTARQVAWALSFSCLACQAETGGLLLPPPGAQDAGRGDSGPADSGPGDVDAGAFDAGPSLVSCGRPTPAGCVESACPPNAICEVGLGCTSSHCECTEAGWACTRDCGGGSCRAPELIFRFSYRSDVPNEQIWLQAHGTIGQEWVQIYDANGARVESQADCGLCSCESCGQCAVCDSTAAMPSPLTAGSNIEWRWNVRTHSLDRCASGPSTSGTCVGDQVLPPGHYVARFCYGYSTVTMPGGTYVESPACSDVPFDWPRLDPLIELDVCACG